MRLLHSAFAASIKAGFLNKSMAVPAIVFAATIIPFLPMLVPPAATACQLCAVVPGTQVAVPKPMVGTTQLTSPTSVEPPPLGSGRPGTTEEVDAKSVCNMPGVCWICFAKASSVGFKVYPPTVCKFEFISVASFSFGKISYTPPITSNSYLVPVPKAAPSAAFSKRFQTSITISRCGERT